MPPFRPVRTNPLLALLVPLIASSSPAVPNDSFPPIAAQHSALELDLRFDSQGRPLLAWIEGVSVSDQQLFVQRRDPSGWVRLGGALNVDPGTAAQGAFVRPRFDGAVRSMLWRIFWCHTQRSPSQTLNCTMSACPPFSLQAAHTAPSKRGRTKAP